MSRPDVLLIGAGIVGACCAWTLARAGVHVELVERGPIGGDATASGMGHVVVMDDSEAEFELTRWSRALWLEMAEELPEACEFRRFGTIWVAADEEEFQAVKSKHAWYAARKVESEILEVRTSTSRPEQGLLKIRTTTLNQRDEVVQMSVGNLVVPRRPA